MSYVQARSKIAMRGQQIGLDFDAEVAALKGAADWDAELARVRDPSLQLPSYYTQPFHAYPEGNLCWEAALQVTTNDTSFAVSMHWYDYYLSGVCMAMGCSPCRSVLGIS